MTKTTNTKEAVLKELAKLYIRVEKSEDERAVAAVVSIVQCGLEALDGNRRCQQTGCERPARHRGKFCSDRCASTARSRRYRQRKDATDSVTVEKYETVKLM